MAAIKETRIDNLSISVRTFDGRKVVTVEGQAYATDGSMLRHFGPKEVTVALTEAELDELDGWLTRAQKVMQATLSISDADLAEGGLRGSVARRASWYVPEPTEPPELPDPTEDRPTTPSRARARRKKE